MHQFAAFGIKPESQAFVGDKISIQRIVNVEIIVEAYKVSPSKFEGKVSRLDLQIIYEGKQRVVFVSSNTLISMIERVPKEKFPFKTKIVNENNRLEFS